MPFRAGNPSLVNLCLLPFSLPCPLAFPAPTLRSVSFSLLLISGVFHDSALTGLQENENIRVMWGLGSKVNVFNLKNDSLF